MAITKAIGKNTVGDGNKMTVRLNNYYRSTHDLSYVWKNTQAVGPIVPFLCEYAQIDDTHEIDLSAMVITHPTVGPLYGSFKLQLDVYVAPIRLYQKLLHNNTMGIGLDMSKVKLPIITAEGMSTDDNPTNIDQWTQINPSALLAYLGLRGWGKFTSSDITVKKNGVPLLAYWDIWKNYYANKQEPNGKVLNTYHIIAKGSINGSVVDNWENYRTLKVGQNTIEINKWDNETEELKVYEGIVRMYNNGETKKGTVRELLGEGTYDSVKSIYKWTIEQKNFEGSISIEYGDSLNIIDFPIKKIDEVREQILSYPATSPYIVTNEKPYSYSEKDKEGKLKSRNAMYGLAVKTYQSDIFNNWIQTEWLDGENGINAISSVDTSSGSFTMDTLNLAKKVYNMLNRIATSDGTYKSWMETVFSSKYVEVTETPVYYGGMSQEIVFEEVVSTSATGEEPLGTLAGKGRLAPNKKGGKVVIKIGEPSYIIGICSITPRLDYSQGNNFTMNWETLNDIHKPPLDMIGFQDLTLEKAAWWTEEHMSDTEFTQKSVGKTVAWIDYMTNYNKNYGNFASGKDENFMTLDRNYNIENPDFTTYIDPAKYNGIFADQSRNAMNFWVQIGVDWKVRRKISAKSIPNL